MNKTACGTKIANMRYVSREVHLSVGRDAPKCRRRLSMASSSPSSRFSSIFRPNSAPKFFFAFSSDVLFDNLGLNIPIFQGSRTCVGNCIFFAIVVPMAAPVTAVPIIWARTSGLGWRMPSVAAMPELTPIMPRALPSLAVGWADRPPSAPMQHRPEIMNLKKK